MRPIAVLALVLSLFGCGDDIKPSSKKTFASFSFQAAHNPGLAGDVTATISGTNIAAKVPAGTDVTHLVATFTADGDHVAVGSVAQVSGVTANDFTNAVSYDVVAADGTKQTYAVRVDFGLATAKELTAFSFKAADNAGLANDVEATISGSAITATVPFGTNVTGLVATFTTTGVSVDVGTTTQGSGVTPNDFTNPVTYRVSAADGSTRDYTVTVAIAPSTAKDLTAFSFRMANNSGLTADVTATITGTDIAATVPHGTDVTALVATFTTTGASVKVGSTVQTSGTTANDFTNPVTYTVTAGDGSTKAYTVTVTIAADTSKDLTAFSFRSADNASLPRDIPATITGTQITATMPFGTNLTALVATFTTTGASVAVGATAQTSGTTPNDFTNPVTYTVTAADGSTKDYTVTLAVDDGSAKDLTAFSFRAADNAGLAADVAGTITGTAIAVTLPPGTSVTSLVATFTTTGASVAVGATAQTSGVTPNDFTNPVTYTVTAANASTQDYTVTVTVPVVTCDALTDPAHGTVVTSNNGTYPSTATYTCAAGYGTTVKTRTCGVDGHWSGTEPTCDATVMVVRVGDGQAALTNASTALALEERRITDGALVRSIALPVAAAGSNNPLTVAGTATTEGMLSLSADRRYITLAGYAIAPGTASVASTASMTVNRVIGRVDATGTVDTTTLLNNAYSATNIRGACTTDGSAFWTAGSSGATGGVQYATLGSTGASTQILTTPANIRACGVFGGQLYVSSASSPFQGVSSVGTGTPTTAAQTALLLAASATPQGFAMVDANPVVTGIDTLYIASTTSPGAGTNTINVEKWTYDGNAWTKQTFTPAFSGAAATAIAVTAWVDGTTVHVVAVTGDSRLVTFDDTGATPTVTALVPAVANTALRGVARSPDVAP